MATPPTTTAAMTFEFEAGAGERLHLRRLDDVHQRGEPGQRAEEHEHQERAEPRRMPASRAASASEPTAYIRRPAGQVAQAEPEPEQQQRAPRRPAATGPAAWEAEPLHAVRQVHELRPGGRGSGPAAA
jgi:hypothetical protein